MTAVRLPHLLPRGCRPAVPWRRRRILLAAGLAAAAMLTAAGWAAPAPAHADCNFGLITLHDEPPPPAESPSAGMAGYVESAPDTVPPPGNGSVPEQSGTTLYEQHGYAGLLWSNYDLGCTRNPWTSIDTAVGNFLLDWAKYWAALAAHLSEIAAEPTFVAVLDNNVQAATDIIFEDGFLIWAGSSIGLLGVWVIILAARGNLAGVVRAAGWALLVFTIVAAVHKYPLAAANLADDAVTGTIGRMNAGFTGKDIAHPRLEHTALIHESVLYRLWLRGEFGSADSAAARANGYELFQAQALTWREDQLKGKPRKMVLDAKKKEWERVAAVLKDIDPEAYRHLKGEGHNRIGSGFLALTSSFILAFFEGFTALYLIYTLLLVRGAAMLLPMLAIVGLWQPASSVINGTAALVGRTLLAAVLYAAANGIGLIVAGQTLGNGDIAPFLALILYLMTMIGLFSAARRLRRGGNRRSHGAMASRWLLSALLLQRLRRRLGGYR